MSDVEVPAEKAPGLACTFYSYKGGVGRSMALANVGVVMATEGYRVLLVDWDLEAPGLETYFRRSARLSGDPAKTPGIIDLIEAHATKRNVPWRQCVLTASFLGHSLDIITAGRKTEDYRQRVQSLNWETLFRDHAIGNFVESLRREWREIYDFILIDSRTGITDIGDICTVLLPDLLVLLFVSNEQNVEGVKQVMERAVRARSKLPVNRSKLLAVPVPSRDERDREYAKSLEWQAIYAKEFAELYREWLPKSVQPKDALNKIYIPYVAGWSFGEGIPVLEEERERNDPSSLGAAYTRLATLLARRLDWAEAFETRASADELVGARAELSKARQDAIAARLRLRNTAAAATLALVIFGAGGWYWYTTRPQPISTDLVVGDNLRDQGELTKALEVYEARRLLLNDLLAKSPDDVENIGSQVVTLRRIGDTRFQQGSLASALASYRQAIPLAVKVASRDSAPASSHVSLSATHVTMGDAYRTQGNFREAANAFAMARNVIQKALANDPNNAELLRELSWVYNRVGELAYFAGEFGEASVSIADCQAAIDKARGGNDVVRGWEPELIDSNSRIAYVLLAKGDLNEASAKAKEVRRLVDGWAADNRGDARRQQYLAVTHDLLGLIAREQGMSDDASANFEADKTIAESLGAKDPDNPFWRSSVGRAHMRIGFEHLKRERPTVAQRSFEAGRAIMDALVALDGENAVWQGDRAAILMGLGRAHVDLKRPDEAVRWLTQADEVYGNTRVTAFAGVHRDAIVNKQHLIAAHLQKGDVVLARKACEQGKELVDGLRIRADNRVFWEPTIAWNLTSCADIAAAEGNKVAEREQLEHAARIQRDLVDKYPTHPWLQTDLERNERRLRAASSLKSQSE